MCLLHNIYKFHKFFFFYTYMCSLQTTPYGSSPHKYVDRQSESSPHVVSSSPQVPSPHAQTLDLSVSRYVS